MAYGAACGQTAFNPFTGKLDCIGTNVAITSSTLVGGSTQYIQNTETPTIANQSFSVGQGIFQATATTMVPVIVIATTSQAVDLTDWDSLSLSKLAYIDGLGDIVTNESGYFGGLTGNYWRLFVNGSAPEADFFISNGRRAVLGYDPGITRATFYDDNGAVGTQLFDSGSIGIGGGVNTLSLNQLQINVGASANAVMANPQSSTAIGFVVKGAASQSADLTDWENSSNVILSSVDANGNIATSTMNVINNLQVNSRSGTSGQCLQSQGPGSPDIWGSCGNGSVNSGTVAQMAYYAANGTTLSGTSNLVNNTSSITVNASLQVNESTSNFYGLSVSTSATAPYIVDVDTFGHINSVGPQPFLSSCGTNPTVTGSDNAFSITPGTGSPNSCTVTFAHARNTQPTCILQSGTDTTSSVITYTYNKTQLVATISGVLTTIPSFDVICIGHD